MTMDFLSETEEARRKWNNSLKVLGKKKKCSDYGSGYKNLYLFQNSQNYILKTVKFSYVKQQKQVAKKNYNSGVDFIN